MTEVEIPEPGNGTWVLVNGNTLLHREDDDLNLEDPERWYSVSQDEWTTWGDVVDFCQKFGRPIVIMTPGDRVL